MARARVLRPARENVRFHLRQLSDDQLRDVVDNTLINLDSLLRFNEALQLELQRREALNQPSDAS